MNIFKLNRSEAEALILSASPTRLVVITYDAAIGSLQSAMEMIDKGDVEGRWKAVECATEMISELYMTLDHDQGGEIAQNLGALYAFILARLPRINFYNDKQTAADAISWLKNLRDSWNQLDISLEQVPPAANAETASEEAAMKA